MDRPPETASVPDLPDQTSLFEHLHEKQRAGRKLIALAIGTRPEVIKVAPLLQALSERPDAYVAVPIVTGQHPAVLTMLEDDFGIRPSVNMNVLHPGQSLNALAGRLFFSAEDLTVMARVEDVHADLWMVQGDTTSAFGVALAAFQNRRPVAHIEAGLRTQDPLDPFPEEMNRRLIGQMASLHFAPTPTARDALLREGIARDRVVVTGNTSIDSLKRTLAKPCDWSQTPLAGLPLERGRLIVATVHRRESWPDLVQIADALRAVADRFADVQLVLPVHPNPEVGRLLRSRLDSHERIHLTPPLEYPVFVHLLQRATVIVTDSGGIQEEAPTLKRPALVLRDGTERAEAARQGQVKVIGRDPARILAECTTLLTDVDAYRAMQQGPNPFGDGCAAARIIGAMDSWFAGRRPLLEPEEEFHLA
jgi:UDP-N-acetylglucosamine 2-epimerase (non-hydrolysing)